MPPARITESTLNSLVGNSVHQFSWYVTVSDGTLSATSTTCTFQYDPTTPGAPKVDYGSVGWTTPSGETIGTIGTKADFSVAPVTGTTISGYNYQLNGAASTFVAATGAVTLHLTPLARTDMLAVTAMLVIASVLFYWR